MYHPPQPRSVERESQAARDRYFVQDALLYRKHPSRFIDLIQREGHMHSNANYVRYLFEGLARYGVAPGRDLLAIIPHDKRIAALGF